MSANNPAQAIDLLGECLGRLYSEAGIVMSGHFDPNKEAERIIHGIRSKVTTSYAGRINDGKLSPLDSIAFSLQAASLMYEEDRNESAKKIYELLNTPIVVAEKN